MVYEYVKWKKHSGSVVLDSSGISFRAVQAASQPQPQPQTNGETHGLSSSTQSLHIPWSRISKHQVSPTTYSKSLLKLNLIDGSSTTFQLPDRQALEKIRRDVTQHLQQLRNGDSNGVGGKKRAFSEVAQSPKDSSSSSSSSLPFSLKRTSFGEMDDTALAVTRSTLLAAHPNLRQQHHFLVTESQTITEEDFWQTHQDLLEEEYARMSGVAKAGSSSLMQSHVPAAGKVTLGVEEMRQIFILYPAVHKAYEEKVPLQLSDEEFWRKYLESEYFHRDRGRMGMAAARHGMDGAGNKSGSTGSGSAGGGGGGAAGDKKRDASSNVNSNANQNAKKGDASKGPTVEEQDARAAAVSADDLFSRYEQKLAEKNAAKAAEGGGANGGTGAGGGAGTVSNEGHRRWGTKLAVGQFDLARTLETERGNKLLQGPRDNHPPNNQADDGGKGARVIEKYNRHWAMVLHPDEAVAGSNLMQVARKSVYDALPEDDDYKAHGGMDKEMRQLSDFAAAGFGQANHAMTLGVHEGENYQQLSLHNVEAYYSGSRTRQQGRPEITEAALAKKHADFSIFMTGKAQALAKDVATNYQDGLLPAEQCFPPAKMGRDLLTALTNRMAEDSRTEAASLDMVNRLPDDFRQQLQSYFRRSSELLRHFFGLRRLEEEYRGTPSAGSYSQKLAKINVAMANFYREMEGVRKDLPQTEMGELMRSMCLPIMEQLDWAFKLHRDGGDGGGGGFVDVEENWS